VSDSLRADAVVPRLRGRLGRTYRYVPECPSTQRLLDADDPEGTVAATDHQTEGRGRLGRDWTDAPGRSVLVSVLLRPRVRADRLPELTPVAGQACADAIAAVAGLETEVKFPNDVLVAGRKVAGILAEASEGTVVLGVGVNVNQTAAELPAATRLPATSLRVESGREHDRGELLVELLARLEVAVDAWVSEASGG
jgi:BirA family transcriptional regulator, biotin operon repressor / biotin---[acetyl-CoA-carboxylase] ligase